MVAWGVWMGAVGVKMGWSGRWVGRGNIWKVEDVEKGRREVEDRTSKGVRDRNAVEK